MASNPMSPNSNPGSISSSDKSQPLLPPLATTAASLRRTSSQRSGSWANRRTSSHSPRPRSSVLIQPRPDSFAYPAFHSSLSYTLVRDFAFPYDHPLHYGSPPQESGVQSPIDEGRRASDPAVHAWEDFRPSWSTSGPWSAETDTSKSRDKLPAMSFHDSGPPYAEDDDLHSPVVTSTRNKKHKPSTGHERGRSPGGSRMDTGGYMNSGEEYHFGSGDGPGEAIEDDNRPSHYRPLHRDSHFAQPLQQSHPGHYDHERMDEDDISEGDEDDRYSKDYEFTIASPDEEMHGKAVALFDFESEHQNELPLREGQIILVSYRQAQGWLVAEDPRTGESGLVPEEFVRLVRDIEGGLNGLHSVNLASEEDMDILSPLNDDNPTEHFSQPPTAPHTDGSAPKPSNGGSGERHPSVRSSFSTSKRDFSPFRIPRGDDQQSGTHLEGSKRDSKISSLK